MTTEPSSNFTKYLLTEMRCAYLRTKILENELSATGVSLRSGLIDPDTAIEHLRDCGALGLIGPEITVPSTH